jgi:hypothetical protein
MKMTDKEYFDPINDHVVVTGSDAGSIMIMDDADKMVTGWSNDFGDGQNVIYISNGDFSDETEDKLPEMLQLGLECLHNPLIDEHGCNTEYPSMVGMLHIRNPRATWFSQYDCSGFMTQPTHTNLRRGTYLIVSCMGLAMETRAPKLDWKDWTISMLMCRISPAIIRKSGLQTHGGKVLEWRPADLTTEDYG